MVFLSGVKGMWVEFTKWLNCGQVVEGVRENCNVNLALVLTCFYLAVFGVRTLQVVFRGAA